jgi:Sulfotransferase family
MSVCAEHKFVFLCGLHRSGTSPLFRILREHPAISGFTDTAAPEDEGQHLQTVFPPAIALGGPGRFGFARDAHLTETSNLVTPHNREKLFAEWSKYWDLQRSYLLEKSPPNLVRTRFLQAMFPNSYFIVIMRHPVAVALATRKWSQLNLSPLIDHWLYCHDVFERDRRHVRNVLVVRYEELIHDAQSHLSHIYRFLGLPLHAGDGLNSRGNERYVALWKQLAQSGKLRRVYGRLIAGYEKRVQQYGYSLLDHDGVHGDALK